MAFFILGSLRPSGKNSLKKAQVWPMALIAHITQMHTQNTFTHACTHLNIYTHTKYIHPHMHAHSNTGCSWKSILCIIVNVWVNVKDKQNKESFTFKMLMSCLLEKCHLSDSRQKCCPTWKKYQSSILSWINSLYKITKRCC